MDLKQIISHSKKYAVLMISSVVILLIISILTKIPQLTIAPLLLGLLLMFSFYSGFDSLKKFKINKLEAASVSCASFVITSLAVSLLSFALFYMELNVNSQTGMPTRTDLLGTFLGLFLVALIINVLVGAIVSLVVGWLGAYVAERFS